MTLDPDPYRTLGLARGATLDEVKRAYRRLAKINHPDAAGEAALPRFLAIQAAYEQLIGGGPGRSTGRRPAPAPRRGWDADRDRGDATRRAYGGRARGESTGSSGTGGAGARGSGPAPRSDGASGGAQGQGSRSWTGRAGAGAGAGAGADAGKGTGGTAGRSRRRPSEPRPESGTTDGPRRSPKSRPSNKATPGSTSYDGADAGPFEPDWGGASWYGTTSGTYWTLNPKEYADPRKHGPEYQARARRAARARKGDAGTAADLGTAADPGAPGADAGPTIHAAGPPPSGPPGGPTHTTSSWWDSTAGPPEDPATRSQTGAATGRRRPAGWEGAAGSASEPPPPDLGRAAADFGRALTDVHYGGLRGRVIRAVIGWLPIALGLGWLVGELTGCGRFAATCDDSADPILLGLQLAVLAVLLVLPALASVAAMAAITLVAGSIAAAFVLSATGAAADGDSRRMALGVVLLAAWFFGLAIAVLQRARALSPPATPVS